MGKKESAGKGNVLFMVIGNLCVVWLLGMCASPYLIGISRLAFFGWSWLAMVIAFLVWMSWSITHDGAQRLRFFVEGEEEDYGSLKNDSENKK